MSFSLSLLLIPYALVVLAFIVLALLNIHHLIHYGATTGTSYAATMIFIVGTLAIALMSWQALGGIDWTMTVTFSPFSIGAVAPTL